MNSINKSKPCLPLSVKQVPYVENLRIEREWKRWIDLINAARVIDVTHLLLNSFLFSPLQGLTSPQEVLLILHIVGFAMSKTVKMSQIVTNK